MPDGTIMVEEPKLFWLYDEGGIWVSATPSEVLEWCETHDPCNAPEPFYYPIDETPPGIRIWQEGDVA